jgi:hypothetical protein
MKQYKSQNRSQKNSHSCVPLRLGYSRCLVAFSLVTTVGVRKREIRSWRLTGADLAPKCVNTGQNSGSKNLRTKETRNYFTEIDSDAPPVTTDA